jgi:hypothetical protein
MIYVGYVRFGSCKDSFRFLSVAKAGMPLPANGILPLSMRSPRRAITATKPGCAAIPDLLICFASSAETDRGASRNPQVADVSAASSTGYWPSVLPRTATSSSDLPNSLRTDPFGRPSFWEVPATSVRGAPPEIL